MGFRKPILILSVLGLAILGAMQMKPVAHTNPPVLSDVAAPPEVNSILREACYDCHSNETRWPWYSRVAPLSWWIVRHTEKGRGDLNFSEWPTYDFEAQDLAFEDIREQVSKGKMPLRSYRWMHSGARLSEAERKTILRWAGTPD